MQKPVLLALMGLSLVTAQAVAQQKAISGRVTSEQGSPLPAVSVTVKGTSASTSTTADGRYSIRADVGQVLVFRLIGTAVVERTVGEDAVIDVQLRRVAMDLDAVVVTALGQTAAQRALATAQQSVAGSEIAQTQRENFFNALSGRIAGVDVTSTSGVPGASSSIVIRGVSSISSSNQPLIIVDALPMDNRTVNTGVLASDRSSTTAFSNRGVDFSNRASDLNSEDIETVTVLKGPEAAALYGIDAANGAIVIKTKRGRPGGGMTYSSAMRVEATSARYGLQRVYGPTTLLSGGTLGSFQYFGAPYASGTQFYDNVDGFLRTGLSQKHSLSFSGATPDNTINYRLATSLDKQAGVVRSSDYDRISVTGASQARINPWLSTDLSMTYTYINNNQVYKGDIGPLMGLMLWPQTDNARDYLTPAGTRRRLTALAAAAELDNPFFNVAKNQINAKTNRLLANVGFVLTPFAWGNIKTNLGTDSYTNQNLLLRHPESAIGATFNGLLDQADVITRNLSALTVLNVYSRPLAHSFSISGLVGHQVNDLKSIANAAVGIGFLDPNFVSMNNTQTRTPQTTTEQRRLVSLFGQAVLNYRDFWYVTVTGRNDWTSTIPLGRNSFFYPSIGTSFVFSDAFPSVRRFVTGKVRLTYAAVGKDARPYAYRPSLQYKTTSYGGYGYDFWGPNLKLKPEFKRSVEGGVELSFLNGRVGLDATAYRATTKDQIVNDIRGSYGTGFILFNLNGAATRSRGLELTVRGTPIQRPGLSWEMVLNWTSAGSIVTHLPNGIPESYVSDTWLWGNVRNGTQVGLSTMSLTGWFYLRNNQGQLLIDPATGLPIRSNAVSANFIDAGYDRQPDFTIGIGNTIRYKRLSLDFLLDIRKGGDIFNATEHYLTTRGLSMLTLDRDQPRVIDGVLRDGRENSANPTPNNIVVIPSVQTAYYTNMSEELFIEKDINWLRLRDLTLRYELPGKLLRARTASVYLTGTDLFIITNYTGLDPIVNGNTAAVGGSGAVGIDFGNFPMPRGVNFGLSVGF
ncbi:MAG TPA: SusC/RagA family TonB-linked outer membrane protein [Gemmatimonadales bacterium]|jgi:TonB-linked SusC/RagA family outer membrane protein|nr:SusC/RagA family TonB-linked outer membrane protein [Gemmatimonadales bacterium]